MLASTVRPLLALSVAGLVLVGGCGADDPPSDPDRVVLAPVDPGEEHTHGSGRAETTIGDGTTAAAGGYALADVRLPPRAGEPGDLTFRVVDPAGDPLRDYVEEQTKQLHLYVVRNDLQHFRHLHPVLGDDGTWSTRVNLPGPGAYRVVAEFTPRTGDQAGDPHVVLGRTEIVAGTWSPEPVSLSATADDGMLQVEAPDLVRSGPDRTMTLALSRVEGGSPTLGSYLGTDAHLTAFDVETGQFAHAHPSGEPEVGEERTELTFHTDFAAPGRYVFFLQVRVDGFVHTVPVGAEVS